MFFVVELVLIIVTSNHTPGLCVDMEGDVDIEKTSLLTKEIPNGSKRGAICKSCGIKRPLRSCHCTEYVLHSIFIRVDVIVVLFVLIITISL